MEVPSRIATRRHTPLDDREIVVAFKGGDVHAYALIYREYRPLAESICLRILGNTEDAQEAAQETMLRVFQGLPRFNGRYLLRAWVARIATNVCLDALRKRGRRPDEIGSPDAQEMEQVDAASARTIVEDPGELVERQDEALRVRGLLNGLPEHHRDALLMREFDGFSHEEIGIKLGITAPQAKALLHRAKKNFKRAWETDGSRASAFTWPALLMPLRWFKRVLSPAREAVVDAAPTVIHLTAQPVVAQATAAFGEKVTAAAGALLVASTIGFGAAALPDQPSDHPKFQQKVQPAVVLAAPALALLGKPSTSAASPAISPSAVGTAATPHSLRLTPKPEASQTDPASSPSASPSETGQPPSPEPSAAPTPPSPTPEAAPSYAFSFTSTLRATSDCGCSQAQVEASHVQGSPNSDYSVDQTVSGGVMDVDGRNGWSVRIRYWGSASLEEGTLSATFTVAGVSGSWSYSASGGRRSVTKASDGTTHMVFRLDYAQAGSASGSPMGLSGSLRVELGIRDDGRVASTTASQL